MKKAYFCEERLSRVLSYHRPCAGAKFLLLLNLSTLTWLFILSKDAGSTRTAVFFFFFLAIDDFHQQPFTEAVSLTEVQLLPHVTAISKKRDAFQLKQ
jgi:hypothetical protein